MRMGLVENLGYVLIGVNILVLLSAVALVVIQFWRSNEEDYQSDNVIAIAKRGIDSQINRDTAKSESSLSGRGSSIFDVFSGFKKKIMGGRNKKMLTEEEDKFGNGAGIEMTDIYGSSTDKLEKDLNNSFNPMAKKAKGDSLSTKKDQSVNKLPAGWEMTTDDLGRPYYYNNITEETSWERP